MSYESFIASKHKRAESHGFEIDEAYFPAEHYKPFQRSAMRFAVRRGRAALFEDTGLGKTRQFLGVSQAWLDRGGASKVLVLAPLGVTRQTVAEGKKIGITVTACRSQGDIVNGINITNYEMLHHFKPEEFDGVVLDESSILRSFMGATKRKLCESFAATKYRLACTATPSPNDHLEIGNQADFLGIMPANQMISRWFINNTMEAGDYRLKHHAAADFWKWVSSWALCISKPSDIGFDDEGYNLPPLTMNTHIVDSSDIPATDGMLFHMPELSATNIHKELRSTKHKRAENVAERVNSHDDPHIAWCYTDYDADELTARIKGAVEIRGSMSVAMKEDRLAGFADGTYRKLVSKPGICGYGLNWQHCNRCDFAGLTYSMESFYQALRRILRFGQKRPVECNVVCSEGEIALLETIQRKESLHLEMFRSMATAMKDSMLENLGLKQLAVYQPGKPMQLPAWMRGAA
jgi:superfamily II DNA or RNA helicase